MLKIAWHGEELALHCEKAVSWPAARTLIIADPHFGKAAAFRSHGIPVPAGTTQFDLERLTGLIERSGARRLVILGDFLHAAAGRALSTMNALEDWRTRWARLRILLVRGNHDLHAGDPPAGWDIECLNSFADPPFSFAHEPPAAAPRGARGSGVAGVFAGHLHPCAVLYEEPPRAGAGRAGSAEIDEPGIGWAGGGMRSPCFVVGRRCAVVPAFGSFTGTHPVSPRRGERIFAVGPGAVVEVPTVAATQA